MMNSMEVTIESSARLHLGFYNFLEDNIAYGSIGVTIETPKVIIKAKHTNDNSLSVINKTNENIDDIINNVVAKLKKLNTDINNLGVELQVLEAIPRHVGLGSTTQISLSIGMALLKMINKPMNIRELAVILGRGRDSGIGIAAFESGGFIVDSGRRLFGNIVEPPRDIHDLPHPIFRASIPRDWYFLIFIPKGVRGFDEINERRIMNFPKDVPIDLKYELYKSLLLHLIPSIINKDIETFGKTLTKIQTITGKYFSKYQGGIFCCEETDFIINSLLKHGAYGAGQSSWGPTAYGIVKGKRAAVKIMNKVRIDIEKRGYDVQYFITRVRNRGAIIKES